MNKKRYSIYIMLGMAVIIAIYALALFVLPLRLKTGAWRYEGRWLKYLFEVVKLLACAFCIESALKSNRNNDRQTTYFMGGCAGLIFLLGSSFTPMRMKFYLQKNLVTLWPVLILILAILIWNQKKKLTIGKWNYSLVLYYVIATVCIWFITDTLSEVDYTKREILEILYLLCCSVGAWFIIQNRKGKKKKSTKKKLLLKSLGLAVLSFVVLMFNHRRLLNVVESFSYPLEAIDGKVPKVNWFGNRMAMMSQGWFGAFEIWGEKIDPMLYDNSLVLIREVFGWGGTAVIFIAEILVIYFIYKIYQSKKAENNNNIWIKMLFYVIICWSAIGLVGEVFLITSSRVGLMLLGNTEIFTVVLIYLYITREQNK